jgi:hypothetical protein
MKEGMNDRMIDYAQRWGEGRAGKKKSNPVTRGTEKPLRVACPAAVMIPAVALLGGTMIACVFACVCVCVCVCVVQYEQDEGTRPS